MFLGDLNQTFGEYYKDQQDFLRIELKQDNIGKAEIDKLCNSGYYMDDNYPDIVFDSFYGTSWGLIAQFSKKEVLEMLTGKFNNNFKRSPPIYHISHINEIHDILSSDDRSRHDLENGYLSYRGQRKEYKIKREFPNPTMSNEDGFERLIIPGVWRKYYPNFNLREIDGGYINIFSKGLVDDLVYYGIDNFRTLGDRNYEKYGIHSTSNLQDFPEKENQEYYKRWIDFKVQGSYNSDLAIVSQHYGLDTLGLDVTFDFKTAGFFATQTLDKKDNGKFTYNAIQNGKHQGVIYCFYFRTPPLTSTKDVIKNLHSFDHLTPIRPIRQQCALPFFLLDRFNEANLYLYAVFYLNENFDCAGLASKEYLFPNTNEDPFYKAVLEVKSNNKFLENFIEYDFD